MPTTTYDFLLTLDPTDDELTSVPDEIEMPEWAFEELDDEDYII